MALFSRQRVRAVLRHGLGRGSTQALPDVSVEHSVIARYQLAAGPTGTATDSSSLYVLEDKLTQAIADARAGEFDGTELGDGEVRLFAYGPDVNRLFQAMEPALRAFPARPAQVVLRYGRYEDADVPESVIEL